MLAACGIAQVAVVRRPRVAVLSTGDELVQPGQPLRPAAIYDTNGAIVTAAMNENGGEASFLGAIADDEEQLEAAMRQALAASDMLVVSGGTSKGAGDVSHRIIARLGTARHHRPWRRAEAGQAAVPCGLRRQAGDHPAGISDLGDVHLPRHDRAGAAADGGTAAAFRCQGQRQKFRCGSPPNSAAPNSSWCRWSKATTGLIAYPTGKGSGAITSFAQADGFLKIDALADQMPAGTAGRGDAVHAACAGAGSGDRRQPLHRA